MWKKNIKYLGILIDSTLSWKHQISNISKNITSYWDYVQIKTLLIYESYEECVL